MIIRLQNSQSIYIKNSRRSHELQQVLWSAESTLSAGAIFIF